MTDFLEEREFYELSQAYRHSPTGLPEWERLKEYIRKYARRSAEQNAAAQASESCGLKPETRDLNRRDSEPAVAAPSDTPETDALDRRCIDTPDEIEETDYRALARKLERARNEARHNCAVAVGKAEELQKDAERYRWIKGHKNEIPCTYSFGGRPYWIVDNNEYDDFDAAIDAARKGGSHEN